MRGPSGYMHCLVPHGKHSHENVHCLGLFTKTENLSLFKVYQSVVTIRHTGWILTLRRKNQASL